MNNGNLIQLTDVDVTHAAAPAVVIRAVSWEIAPGDCWVVGGAPASGKTSLLATAAGLQTPAGGTLRILGGALAQATEAEQIAWRRSIGFVFANGGRLLHHLTVAENVALPLEYHLEQDTGQTAARVAELLTRAELLPLAAAMPSRLSGRLQQRASLMRALAVPTQVLFLDDPLSGLAPRDVRWWLDLLAELRARATAAGPPLTVVASCSDFRGWLDTATQFGVIEGDRFRVLGGRAHVLASETAAVRELLDGRNH